MVDLVTLGFKIDMGGINEANKALETLINKAEKLEKEGSKAGQSLSNSMSEAATRAEDAARAVQNASQQSTKADSDGYSKRKKSAEDYLNTQRRIKEIMAEGFTKGEATKIQSFEIHLEKKPLDEAKRLLDEFKVQLEAIRRIAGKDNPFDSVVGPSRKLADNLEVSRLQMEALQKGTGLTKSDLQNLVIIERQVTESLKAQGLAQKDISDAVAKEKTEFLQKLTTYKAIQAQIDATVSASRQQTSELEKQQKLLSENSAKAAYYNQISSAKEGDRFTKSQARDIVKLTGAGAGQDEIDKLKASFDALNGTQEKAEQRRIAAIHAEAIAENRRYDRAKVEEEKRLGAIQREAIAENRRYDNSVANEKKRLEIIKMQEDLMRGGMTRSDASAVARARVTMSPDAANEYEKHIAGMRALQQEATKTSRVMDFFKGALLAAVGYNSLQGLAFLARDLFNLMDDFTNLQNRLKLVTKSSDEAAAAQAQLFDIARETRQPVGELITLYTRLAMALQTTQYSSEDAMRVSKVFGKTLIISGAGIRESSSALLQFSQALQSGKLAGDEFRSMAENNPAVLRAIADGAGVARTELKKMSADGKLTTEFIVEALERYEQMASILADGLPKTFGQSMIDARNGLIDLMAAFNDTFGITNAFRDIVVGLSGMLEGATKFIREHKDAISSLGSAFGVAWKVLKELITAFIIYKTVALAAVKTTGLASAVSFVYATTQYSVATATGTATVAQRVFATATTLSSIAVDVLTVSLKGLVAAIVSNPWVAVITGLLLVGTHLLMMKDSFEEAEKAKKAFDKSFSDAKIIYESTADSLRKQGTALKDMIDTYPELEKAVNKTFNKDNLTEAQRKEVSDLTDKMNEQITTAKELGKTTEELVTIKNTWSGIIQFTAARIEAENRVIAMQSRTILDLAENMKVLGEIKELKVSSQLMKDFGISADIAKTAVKQLKAESFSNILSGAISKEDKEAIEKAIKDAKELEALQKKFSKSGRKSKEETDPYKERLAILQREAKFLKEGKDTAVAKMMAEKDYVKWHKDNAKIAGDIAKTDSLNDSTEKLNKAIAISKISGETLDVDQRKLMIGKKLGVISEEEYQTRLKILAVNSAVDLDDAVTKEQRKLEGLQKLLQAEELITREKYTQGKIATGMSPDEASQMYDRQRAALEDTKKSIEGITERFNNAKDVIEKMKDYTKDSITNPFKEFEGYDFKNLFDGIGDPINGLVKSLSTAADGFAALENSYAQLAARQKDLDLSKTSGDPEVRKRALEEEAQLTEAKRALDAKSTREGLKGMASMLSATKGFFKEKSSGYKTIQKLEKATALIQLAMDAKKMASTAAETVSKIIAYTTQGTAAAAAAVAGQAATGGPAAWPLMAAMAAAMAAIGFSVRGGGSGVSVPSPNEGTGTVLGDSSAKSESIGKAIGALSDINKEELVLTNNMLSELRQIRDNTAGLAALLVRMGVSTNTPSFIRTGTTLGGAGKAQSGLGMLFTSGLSPQKVNDVLGDNFIGDVGAALIEGVQSVFNAVGKFLSSKKVSVVGQGLFVGKENINSITSSGADVSSYTDVVTTRRTLGIKTKQTLNTVFQSVDNEVTSQFTKVFTNLSNVARAAGTSLGMSTSSIENVLDNFVVEIGRISTAGKTGQQVQETLNAVFGAVGDKLAKALAPNLEGFQKVGEGYLETLTRVASGIEQAKYALKEWGLSIVDFNTLSNKQGDVAAELLRQSILAGETAVGVRDIVAVYGDTFEDVTNVYRALVAVKTGIKDIGGDVNAVGASLISGAGGLDKLQSSISTYFDKVLTDNERDIAAQRKLQEQFAKLGLSVPATVAAYRQLVEGTDTSTASGQELYGALLSLAGAFVDTKKSAEDLMDTLANNLTSAYKTFLDASRRAKDNLQKSYDSQKTIVQTTIDNFKKWTDSLKKFRDELTSGSYALLSPDAKYQATKADFEDVKNKALAGDTDAIDKLQDTSKAYLDASKEYYASSSQYFADLADVLSVLDSTVDYSEQQQSIAQTQLDTLKNQVDVLLGIDGTLLSIDDAINNYLAIGDIESQVNSTLIANGFASVVNGFDSVDTQLSKVVEASVKVFEAMNAVIEAQNRTGIQKFATGGVFTNGIVNRPTMFNMALMGEAGSEAIMPLAKASDGSLGVKVIGGMPDNSVLALNTSETNRHLSALVRLQQASNTAMIDKLSDMDNRLQGMESSQRLQALA